jgi:hypothetical protein
VSGAWVAGTVRSRALARRRVGRAGVRALALSPSLDEALAVVSAGPYGHDVRPGQSLAAAQHALGAALLWNLRVLAGWLPREGIEVLRAFAGWFEIAGIDELLHRLDGGSVHDGADGGVPEGGTTDTGPYRLGALATAWPQLRDATSLADLRERLARSAWGDPGGDRPRDVQLAVRLSLAERLAAVAPPARPWAAGGVALLVAREVVLPRRPLPEALVPAAAGLLGPAAPAAAGLREYTRDLAGPARWALEGVTAPDDLWAAESRFWRRVESDGVRLARTPVWGLAPVVGTVASLAVDAWRVRAALTLAARQQATPEMLDVLV